ncbi:MAG: hypothetical protein ABJB47_13285 [Actinomycetota bacterium]
MYLRYNRCLPDSGFQRLAAQALALLQAHRDYRLIVDLRDNGGGDSAPFQSLISGLQADPRLRVPGRVIGPVGQFTASSATLDAQSLKQAGEVLIGQPPSDPVDEWGQHSDVPAAPQLPQLSRPALSELAHARGWEVHLFDAKEVVNQAARMLDHRADQILLSPRATLGPPWAKDHRVALAATIVAS